MYISSEKLRPGPAHLHASEPALLDNPYAPQLFATGCAGVCNLGGIISLTLENLQCDHSQLEPVPERVVVGRLALPVPTAQALVLALNGFLEEQGLSPSKAASKGELQ